ncbi:MAG: hypothetical protein MUE81_20325 [Thermoflexibacter sp.]|jgi:hypothetical protein|nr:hypothetical protein [Thermoflexibacter sp.]
MESILVLPKNREELSFLAELLKKLNITVKVLSESENELLGYAINYEEPSTETLLQMSAPSLHEVWENEDNEVWNSYLTKEELIANV